ncbi:helix-turn-helix domain-containing protein [Nocardia sp. NPDC046763]|uniref:MmyB family transcriptional regulator n=1 Tax=Nocardia sp. NPDC046763 TaxID=3155256 RepID=UPI0033E68A9B
MGISIADGPSVGGGHGRGHGQVCVRGQLELQAPMDAPVAVEPPSFGEVLRRLRDERRVSRERLAMAAGVSASYITHLELGRRGRPTQPVVDALFGCLDRVHPVPYRSRRYLFDLAGLPDRAAPEPAALRAAVTPAMLRRLERLDPDPAGYVDSRWNVLALNRSAHRAFPGLAEGGCWLTWLLDDPRSAAAVIDREAAARASIAVLRARIATHDAQEWSIPYLRELGRNPEFRRLWSESGDCHDAGERVVRLRGPRGGTEVPLDLQLYDVESARYPGWIRMLWGMAG